MSWAATGLGTLPPFLGLLRGFLGTLFLAPGVLPGARTAGAAGASGASPASSGPAGSASNDTGRLTNRPPT